MDQNKSLGLSNIESSLMNIENLLHKLNNKFDQQNELLSELVNQSKPKPMLGHKAAAEYLGIHTSTLQQRMQAGKIPVYKIGTKKLYKKFDLDAWLDAHASKRIAA